MPSKTPLTLPPQPHRRTRLEHLGGGAVHDALAKGNQALRGHRAALKLELLAAGAVKADDLGRLDVGGQPKVVDDGLAVLGLGLGGDHDDLALELGRGSQQSGVQVGALGKVGARRHHDDLRGV